MNVIQALGLAGWAFRSALGQSFRLRLWAPFLLLALVQMGSLAVLLRFYEPGVSWLAVPLITWLVGESGIHYPYFFAALPGIYVRWSMVLGVLLATLTTGAATILFARAFGVDTRGAWRTAAARYPALLAVGIVGAVLSLGLFLLGDVVPRDLFLTSSKVRWGVRFASLLLFVIGQSLVVYATAAVVIEGRGIGAALWGSVRLFGLLFVATLVVVGIPVALNYPLGYLTERPDWFLNKFTPELLGIVLALKVVWEMLLSFVLVGAVTRLFVWRREVA